MKFNKLLLVGTVLVCMVFSLAIKAAEKMDSKILVPIISLLLDDSGIDLEVTNHVFSSIPEANSPSLLQFLTDDSGQISCHVASEPDGANVTFEAVGGNAIEIIATIAGDYELSCASLSNQSTKLISFSVVEAHLPFDQQQLTDPDNNKGEVLNQRWVYSSTLDESTLKAIIEKYGVFTVIGTDEDRGTLIQFDHTSLSNTEALELLRLEPKIDYILRRMQNVINPSTSSVDFFPTEGSDIAWNTGGFADGNYSLVETKMPQIWGLIRQGNGNPASQLVGNPNLSIGVCDGGFNELHPELSSRVILSKSYYDAKLSGNHGNAVAGIIGAETDNGTGISGINHQSKLIFGIFDDCVKAMSKEVKVGVINNSWSESWGPIISTYNHDNSEDRANRLKSVKESFIDLIPFINKDDKLFVWAAGNGIGGASGSQNGTKYYGIDASYSNGVIHRLGGVKSNNIVVAAAIPNSEGPVLPYYSNFGRHVDIAAYTDVKAPKDVGYWETDDIYGLNHGPYDEADKGPFDGTSAAAPFVTGIASLLFSILPDATPADVKNIIINTSTESVDSRYSAIGVNAEIVSLPGNSIPLINPLKAVEFALDLKRGREALLAAKYIGPKNASSQNTMKIKLSTLHPSVSVTGFRGELRRCNVWGGCEFESQWEFDSNIDRTNSIAFLTVPDGYSSYRFEGSVDLVGASGITTVISNKTIFDTRKTEIRIQSGDVELDGVTYKLEPTGANVSPFDDPNQEEGLLLGNSVNFGLAVGDYKIHLSKSGYLDFSTKFSINSEREDIPLVFNLVPDDGVLVGSLSGIVTDEAGGPIIGANVSLFGGGFTYNVVTDSNGFYRISEVSKLTQTLEAIFDFGLTVSADNYVTKTLSDVVVLTGKEVSKGVSLNRLQMSESLVSGRNPEVDNLVLAPNGGESWYYGQTKQVRWRSSEISGSSVDLYVLHDDPTGLFSSSNVGAQVNSKNWYKFAEGVSNTGSYSMDPSDMNGGGNAYVLLIVSSEDNSQWDIGDGMFELGREPLPSSPYIVQYSGSPSSLQQYTSNITGGFIRYLDDGTEIGFIVKITGTASSGDKFEYRQCIIYDQSYSNHPEVCTSESGNKLKAWLNGQVVPYLDTSGFSSSSSHSSVDGNISATFSAQNPEDGSELVYGQIDMQGLPSVASDIN